MHKDLDLAREARAGKAKIELLIRGGPAYEDKVARRSIKLNDLNNLENIKDKIEVNTRMHHNILRHAYELDLLSVDDVYQYLLEIKKDIIPFVANTWRILNDMKQNNKRVLFEKVPKVFDVDFGTYPFCYILKYAGVRPQLALAWVKNILIIGITKAYTTRVGSGPSPPGI